jgi:hypothetical protein
MTKMHIAVSKGSGNLMLLTRHGSPEPPAMHHGKRAIEVNRLYLSAMTAG